MEITISTPSALLGSAVTFAAVLLLSPQITTTSESIITGEQREILSHMSIEYLDDGQGGTNKTIRIAGVDLQVVNGLGETMSSSNGVGNLIVGYNELGAPLEDARRGSHNVIVGINNSYWSNGGAAIGSAHTLAGRHAAVVGGHLNSALSQWSLVAGGSSNTATGSESVVSGGCCNTASGPKSVVSGGIENEASGVMSAISGGQANAASGRHSSVTGGFNNSAEGERSAVSGGSGRRAPDDYDWAAGSLWEDE